MLNFSFRGLEPGFASGLMGSYEIDMNKDEVVHGVHFCQVGAHGCGGEYTEIPRTC